ncbi:hypothetical protein CUB90_07365 [Clostridium sp. CT7]|uniref:ABC transporter permease n=1 Tax=Clostridium sp. CT7 TaxID=2052574 RepID=UPI0008246380|nr:ABC transporter permease [Clostridium sp. CT7]PJI07690.1 hypothetical protein CUB90_07365 [Clostridium sp. CT7]
MNAKKIIKLNFIIWLIVFIAILVGSAYFNYMLSLEVPNMVEYKRISSNGITFQELNKVKEKCSNLNFTGYAENTCNVKNKYEVIPNKDIKTKVVLTDENFFQLYPYKLIDGGKLDYLSVKNGNRVAVISDNLANALYKTTKIVGDIIIINDEKYKIIGVYKTNKSFTYSMSDDGYERIMIPYSSYRVSDKKESLSVDVFTIRDTVQNNASKINNKLIEVVGSKLSLYSMLNYTISKKISFQYTLIMCFLVGSCGIIYFIKLLIKYIKEFNQLIKDNLKNKYFWCLVKENTKEILINIGKITICLVCIVLIFKLIKFNIVIQDSYLPADNIFDFEFYRKAIVKNVQLVNAKENGFSNIYNRYLTNITGIEKIALVEEILAFIFALINGVALIKSKYSYSVKYNFNLLKNDTVKKFIGM